MTDKRRELLNGIEERQRRLIHDLKKDAYTDLLWTFSPDKAKENYNQDGLTLVDIETFWNTLEFIKEKETDFTRDDIPRLIGAIPSFIACMVSNDETSPLTPLRFALFASERVGSIPVERHIARKHANIGEERENAIESIELTKDLINAFLGIDNEDLKALIVYDLVYFMPLLEDWRDGIEREEGGFNEAGGRETMLRREYEQALTYAEALGVETALIDRANRLKEEGFSELKEIIGK